MPRHIVCLTFDFDTHSGFIARGLTTPTPLSRGEFGALGSRRLIEFLKSRNIRSTWFIPGYTIETYPRESEAVVAAGHEVGHHSWAHVPNATQTREEEEADLLRASECVVRLTGRKAVGYRSPSWDLSPNTIDLLLAHGFQYDSSLMGHVVDRMHPFGLKSATAGDQMMACGRWRGVDLAWSDDCTSIPTQGRVRTADISDFAYLPGAIWDWL